jgi:transcriptional regulator with XRE-family HTH domain
MSTDRENTSTALSAVELSDGPGSAYRHRAAALLRSAANDLKRDHSNAARDLGLSLEEYSAYVSGALAPNWELIERAAKVWPLNERDLLPIHDDVPHGLRIVTREESRATARVLQRGGVDYYEYRDTAMSRVASFRPEYIKMLQSVSDEDAANPSVQWNEGHLLYQLTYFVGPVNYYYSWHGQLRCVPMNTGDSVWAVPFAPHSFAARRRDSGAHILALTYGGELVGDPQRELAVLGTRTTAAIALPITSESETSGAMLRSLLRTRLLTNAELSSVAHVAPQRLAALCMGNDVPTPTELAALAAALRVAVRDLMPRTTATVDGVSIHRKSGSRRWRLPDGDGNAYDVTLLAGDPIHPETTAFELVVPAEALVDPDVLRSHQHTYLYILSGHGDLVWHHHGRPYTAELDTGDSAYALPEVGIGMRGRDGRPMRVLLVRIGGAVSTDVRSVLSLLSCRHIERYLYEDAQWYRTEGRSAVGLTNAEVK